MRFRWAGPGPGDGEGSRGPRDGGGRAVAGGRGQTRTATDAVQRVKRPDQRRELPRRLGGRSVVVANSLVSLRNCRPRRPQRSPA